MTTFVDSTRAELLRLRKWPVVWVVVGAWLALGLMFGYAFDYIAYRTGSGPAAGDLSRAQLLAQVLPSGVPDVLIQGTPLFGAALAMVLGALAAGNGFGWGTWKTSFTQGPSRGAVVGGSLMAISVFVLLVMVLSLALYLGLATGIAALEGQAVDLPGAVDLARSFGTGLLVLEMWVLFGYLVAVLAKGPALAIGLGIVWVLVVENLLRSVGGILSVIEQLTRVLPGTAGGSLVGAVISGSRIGTNGTPGILTDIGGGRALVTVAVYVVLTAGLAVGVMRRRDVA